jgi:hypothetical protein
MAVLLTNVSNALEKVILPYIQDNFNKQTILLDQVKRNKGVTFMNDYFYAPIRSSRHGGVTNLANDGNSLVSGKSSIGQAYVGVKILTGTFDISKLVLDATKTAKGAVENQLTFQATTLASDFAKGVNRQLYGDGIGAISQVSATGTTTVVMTYPDANLNDGRAQDNYGSVNGDIGPTDYIFPDMILGMGSAGSSLGTVSSVGTNGTVTFTGAAAGTANDPVYIMDGSGAGAGTSEITGIGAALSSSTGTSTYANLARNTTGWTPQVGTTAEALTLSAMEKVYLAARKYSQMGDQYAIFCNQTLYKKYGDILTSLRRTVNETDLLGGWSGLEFAAGAGKVGVFLDYDVPDGEVLILDLDTFTMCQVSDMGWMEDPKSGTLQRRRDTLTYQATMAWFMNLLCLAPAANGRLTQKTA